VHLTDPQKTSDTITVTIKNLVSICVYRLPFSAYQNIGKNKPVLSGIKAAVVRFFVQPRLSGAVAGFIGRGFGKGRF